VVPSEAGGRLMDNVFVEQRWCSVERD